MKDFDEITRVGVDGGDSEEHNESAYVELVEFVRVGVQLVFDELAVLRAQPRWMKTPWTTVRPFVAPSIEPSHEVEAIRVRRPRTRARSVPKDEFARRRQHLMKLMGKDSIAVVSAAPVRLRNNDVEYAYRQDSDFFYLTGVRRARVRGRAGAGPRAGASTCCFVRDRDPAREPWDGRRAGPGRGRSHFGADDAFPIADMDEILPGLLENRTKVYYTMGPSPSSTSASSAG